MESIIFKLFLDFLIMASIWSSYLSFFVEERVQTSPYKMLVTISPLNNRTFGVFRIPHQDIKLGFSLNPLFASLVTLPIKVENWVDNSPSYTLHC
jgi:hypothetical protein